MMRSEDQQQSADPASRARLLCDIDGVVYPYMEQMQPVVERMEGRTLPAPRCYNLQTAWGIHPSTQKAAHMEVFAAVSNHSAEPMAGAKRTLWALSDAGVEIAFLTRRAHYTQSIGGSFDGAAMLTGLWLETWAPPHTLHHAEDKSLFVEWSTLMLEDNPSEADAMIAAGRKVWLIDQPYNRDSQVKRVKWDDREIIDEIRSADAHVGAAA